MAKGTCQISNETGANLEFRKSRLTGEDLLVKVSYWEQGYEPRWLIRVYAQSLYRQAGNKWSGLDNQPRLMKVLNNRLYFGEKLDFLELIG